ncbi:hypothetical protein HAZT_HAZT004891 [Hyalella azteca]|uniref:Peptidase M1 membrane alanine aminopeptidase domain-containing protein n=1 Tax=Hyalella azteca TaxID=294128 RepID=A0A6A0H9F2_HYAAZ|nr:hypothetical protein HAZT_HAZT004891 [Hyalella azteca]
MNELTHFCLPQLLPVMKACSKYLHQAFEFFEEMLSIRYPYTSYKQVYVDEAYSDLQSYATMSVVSQNLLCSSRIIDQVYETREVIVLSVARQFFGCFLTRYSWSDSWLCEGVARYLTGLYLKKYFGFNHYKHWIHSELQSVVEYEEEFGSIVLDPSSCPTEPKIPTLASLNRSSKQGSPSNSNTPAKPSFSETGRNRHFGAGGVKNAHACSPRYIDMYYKKSQLIMRMLEIRIGHELMMQAC